MAKDLFQVGDLVMHSDDGELGVVLQAPRRTPGGGYRFGVKVLFADQDIDWIQTRYLSLVCKLTTDMV